MLGRGRTQLSLKGDVHAGAADACGAVRQVQQACATLVSSKAEARRDEHAAGGMPRRRLSPQSPLSNCDATHTPWALAASQGRPSCTGRMSKSNSGSSKRPADELQGPSEQQQATSLHRLADQIAFFELQAAEGAGTEPPPAKKGAQLHCLVQNTTHRKIR